MNKKSDLEKSSSSVLSELSEKSGKTQKYYYLYKVGGKYFLRKKDKKNLKDKSLTKYSIGKTNMKLIELYVNSAFKYKYNKAFQYNMIIINRLIYNINSFVVNSFKENLILFDENEFFFRFYEIKNSKQLLKKILDYYELNNVIYPNYISLYEGNYIFNNIEQKQKIIDRQEKIIKNKKDKLIKSEDNNEENILDSNVVESILNQTNTSETKRFFGLNNDSNYFEENDDFTQINSLIKNIEKFDKKENANKIFKKKNLIRIINDKNKNNKIKEKYVKKDINALIKENIKTKKNSYERKLLSTISYFDKFKSKFKIKDDNATNNTIINNKQYFSNTYYHKKNDTNNLSNIHKRINTLDTHKIRTKFLIFANNSINFRNNSPIIFKSPYYTKKTINKENITYSKKKIYQNFSRKNKNIIHKISKSINPVSISKFNLDSDYFNLDNNFNGIKVYKKKIQKINTDYNTENSKEKKYIRSRPKIISNQLSIPIRTYISSDKNKKINYKYNRVSPSPNFKIIAKMLKSKYLIDDKINNKVNSIPLTSRNTLINNNFKKIKNTNSTKRDDNIKNYTTKNIYISNNITNNNFYSISNGAKKNFKILIKRNIKNNETNKRNKEKLNIKEYKFDKLEKLGNLSVNSRSRNIKMNKYIKSNNSKLNQYKNGLINSTILKSLDKNSINHLLNKFENSSNSKNLSVSNNNIKYTTINEIKNENKRYKNF